jgi:hypothetical protein
MAWKSFFRGVEEKYIASSQRVSTVLLPLNVNIKLFDQKSAFFCLVNVIPDLLMYPAGIQ